MTCIRYHTWWPSSGDPFYLGNVAENTARTNYYQPGGKYVPRAFIDGIIDGEYFYSSWGSMIRGRAPVPSPVDIQTYAYFTGPRDGNIGVEVQAIDSISFSNLRLFVVITEDGIPYSGKTYNQTMRDMIPGSTGDPVTLSLPGDTLLREYGFSIDAGWVIDSCNAAVFLQDYTTKEILQSAVPRLTSMVGRDVKPILLLNPGATVACDSTYTVQVRVENSGEMWETFDVSCRIDTMGQVVYNETETVVSLAPDSTFDVTFALDWQVPIADNMTYDFTVVTMLAADDSTHNDTLFVSASSRCVRDVAPTSIIWPPDTVFCSSSSEPRVTVANLGQMEEGFDVVFSIDTSGSNVYADTAAVLNLGSAETTSVAFSTWTVPVLDGMNYDLTVWTELAEDTDTTNDTLRGASWGWCYAWEDVYPSLIISPVDTVLCDSMGTISVRAVNAGGFDEDFDVGVAIDTNGAVLYGDTTTVLDLTAGDSTEVVFSGWTVPSLDSTTYGVRFWTMLASDSAVGNDTLSGYFYGYCIYRDCGVVSILAPPDTVSIDTTNTPRVSVRNWGNITETFDVVCTIDGYADTQQVADLVPGLESEVIFAPWNAGMPGSYLMTVVTDLLSDENPQNDSASKTIWGITGVCEQHSRAGVPLTSRILRNRPNPLTSHAIIDYCIARPGSASLSVYDASGRLVRVLFDGHLKPGYYTVLWKGDDASGTMVPNGVYFYRLTAGTVEASRKTVVVR